LASIFAGAGKQIKVTDSDDKVINDIRTTAKGAINETYKILLKRIDKFGVAQPNINLDENKGIIQVELAGVTDKERVRKYLQASANLQFWAVYNLDEIGKGYESAATSLAAFLSGTNVDSVNVADSAKKAKFASALYEVMMPLDIRAEKIPYNRQFNFITHAKDTATLNYYLTLDAVKNGFPSDSKILLGADVKDENIMIHGWQQSAGLNIIDYISAYINKGINQIFCTDISKDGLLQGTSIDLYKKILIAFPQLHLIASGGVTKIEDVIALKEIGCNGVIIGKAIYEGKIKLHDLVKLN